MRPSYLIVLSSALALVVLSGCQTPQSSGGGESSSSQPSSSSGSSGSASPPASESPSQPAPAPAPTTSGAANPQSSQSAGTATPEGAGSAQPGEAQTPDERRAAIERRLDSSLGTFDEQIRKEQERVARERDARDAATTATEGTESDATREGEGEGQPGTADTESPPVANTDARSDETSSRPGDLRSDKDRAGGVNSGAASGSGATTQNIPDGSDDDIVARRLRKAAEQETDPELKDRLWKEYIEYKKNAGN